MAVYLELHKCALLHFLVPAIHQILTIYLS